MNNTWNRLQHEVYLVRTASPDYEHSQSAEFSELPHVHTASNALGALRSLLHNASLDQDHFGTPEWNPLGEIIRKSAKVLIKPNWVRHRNGSGSGLDCLVTNTSLIDAVLEYLVLAGISEVVIGDAPVQGCDFEKLLESIGIPQVQSKYESRGVNVSVRDFRLVSVDEYMRAKPSEIASRSADTDYALFDLATKSELEPISGDCKKFRVTMY